MVALFCVTAILAIACVQAVHVHAAQTRGLDTRCSICVVSHSTVRPQQAFLVVRPLMVQGWTAIAQASPRADIAILDLFVRPPPAA